MGACVWYVIWTWLQGPRNLSWSPCCHPGASFPSPPGNQAVCKAGLWHLLHLVQVCSNLPPHTRGVIKQRWLMAHYPALTALLLLHMELLKPVCLATAETWHWWGWAREGGDLLFPRVNLSCKSLTFAAEPFGKAVGDAAVMNGANLEIQFWILSSLLGNIWICSAWPENHKEKFFLA